MWQRRSTAQARGLHLMVDTVMDGVDGVDGMDAMDAMDGMAPSPAGDQSHCTNSSTLLSGSAI